MQVYQSASGYVPATTTQYQAQSVATNTVSNSSTGYQTSYQGSSSFQSTPQAYQPSATTFTSPITQTSGAYQSAAQSVSIYFDRNFSIRAVSELKITGTRYLYLKL